MRLEIELQQQVFAVQQNIPLRLRLHNDGAGVEVPFEYDCTDVLALTLLDSEGCSICRADGYARMERQGVRERPVPQAEMQTGTLPADGILQWDGDLLLFMDAPVSGNYFVRADFRFLPSGIDLRSPDVAIEIKPGNPDWVDVAEDQVSIAMTYVLQTAGCATDRAGILRISSRSCPEAFWKGGTITLPPGAEPRISEADFRTLETFEYDLFRWIVWLRQNSLQAIQFREDAAASGTYAHALGDGEWRLAGRPIQHPDLGVSVPIARHGEGGFDVSWLEFDETFALVRETEVASAVAAPTHLASGANWSGRRYLAFAEEGGFPLRMVEMAGDGGVLRELHIDAGVVPAVREEADAGNGVRILALRSVVKGPEILDKCFLILSLSEGEPGNRMLFHRLPLSGRSGTSEVLHAGTVELPQGFLEEDEQILTGSLAETGCSGIHAVVQTSNGRLLHAAMDGSLRTLEAPENAGIARPGPFLVISNDIHLFFARHDGRGMVHRVIYTSPRR